jgi:hypothetical protein
MTVPSPSIYVQIASRLSNIVAQTAAPEGIRAALQGVLNAQPLDRGGQADWGEFRKTTAITVLTNLTLLEDGMRQTAIINNLEAAYPGVNLSPPLGAGGDDVPLEFVKDPIARRKALDYRILNGASGKLWNLHQALLAEYRLHWNATIKLLVDSYSMPPPADAEIRQLSEAFSRCSCTSEFTNQVYRSH